MDQAVAKRTLQELIRRDDLGNKTCADCSNPNPQWASVSFAVFICLQCAGAHRSYGVHVSFVRSVSMDTWSDEQIKRMQLGGNRPFHEFIQSYTPTDQGGYSPGISTHDKYHCWAATQYREKLDHVLQDKPWSPSPPPEGLSSPPERPSSAQGLRKSRATGGRGASNLRTGSNSPAPSANSASAEQKSANEAYFASLGSANAARPDNLPPSQGGRYTGFGSTASAPADEHPSYSLSSRAAPTLSELQENPVAALSKGWSLFTGAVVGASKAINENVIQPGMERVNDPNFQAGVRGYVDTAGRTLNQASQSANSWGRAQFGVDVAGQIGNFIGNDRTRRGEYGSVSQGGFADETSALYHDDEDDLFHDAHDNAGSSVPRTTAATTTTTSTSAPAAPAKGKDEWDDEWKDF